IIDYLMCTKVVMGHQGGVAAKYRIGSLNFFQSLTTYDHVCFTYIARESQELEVDNEIQELEVDDEIQKSQELEVDDEIQKSQELEVDDEIQKSQELDVDEVIATEHSAFFNSFLETIKRNYEN
ncbi:5894_t:CDS:2, partial [Racocetra persica]